MLGKVERDPLAKTLISTERRERERENEKWEKGGERESVVGGMYVHATPSPQITVWERRWRVGNSQEM